MSTTTKPAWTLAQVVALLEKVPLFEGLPQADLETVAGLMRGRAVGEGEMLFREGDPGDKFYVVFTGAVEILKERPKGDHERLAIKRAGEGFGEMSLLTDAPRSASVRAMEPSQLMVCSREQFIQMLGGETLAVRLMRGLARALRALDVRFAARESAVPDSPNALREFNRMIQRGLLPREMSVVEGYEAAAAVIQSEESIARSGWDFVPYDDGALFIAMDVKGGAAIPPAHFLAIARALLRQAARHRDDFDRILALVNIGLSESLHEGLDACVEAGLLGVHADGVRFSAAGDQPAVVVRTSGDIEELGNHGPPLGILPRFDYGVTPVRLNSGDCLLLFSELEPGVVRGAAELVRSQQLGSAAEIAAALEGALRGMKAKSGDNADLALVVVRKN